VASLAVTAVASEAAVGIGDLKVPPGFVVELAAAPPLVERPMLASFDDQGRLYVADSAGVNLRGAELLKAPPHVIRRLTDTDGDGRFDKSEVYADKLVFPQGILWHDGAVFVSSPPSFWKLTDTDGDGKADQREELVTGFANTGVADDMHGASLGPDGRVYWLAGRFPHEIRKPGGPLIHKGTAPLLLRCKPDGSEIEVVSGTQGNGVGVVFDQAGDMFTCGTFLAPDSMGAGLRDALVHCIDGGEYPVRDRVLNEHKRTGPDLLPPLAHLGVAAGSDLELYRGTAFGPEYQGNLFSCLFNMHKIGRHVLTPAGATWQSHNEDFVVSEHADFHPTDTLEDADGSLLVVDTGGWFRIGCPTSQIAKPEVLGAIYRVRREGAAKVDDPRGLKLNWARLQCNDLAKLLGDERPAVRDRAIRELGRLSDSVSLGQLAGTVRHGSPRAACNALWAAARIDNPAALEPVRGALEHPNAQVRQTAARVLGLRRDTAFATAVARLLNDDSAPVRREAATALGRMRDEGAVPGLLAALPGASSDRFLQHALIFALIEIGNREATRRGLHSELPAMHRGALIALDQMENGQLEFRDAVNVLDYPDESLREAGRWIVSRHPEWSRELVPYFRAMLNVDRLDEGSELALRAQLTAFAGQDGVRQLIGEALERPETSAHVRRVILEAIALSPPKALPTEWVAGLRANLQSADEGVARQAVAALRRLPADPAKLAERIDSQIDFPHGPNFPDVPEEDYYSRWKGVLRVPTAGKQTLFTESDDGSRLWLDGQVVVDNSGSHPVQRVTKDIELSAGDHELLVEFVQGGGEAYCVVGAMCDGKPTPFAAEQLLHRAGDELKPGLQATVYAADGGDAFPPVRDDNFTAELLALAADGVRSSALRVEALGAVAPQLVSLSEPQFRLLTHALANEQVLVRLAAAEALTRAPLSPEQLFDLFYPLQHASVLEAPKLLAVFDRGGDAQLGHALLRAVQESPGLARVQPALLSAALADFPEEIRQAAAPLLAKLAPDTMRQQARLESLQAALAGGDIQRGNTLFFGAKAICSTCHTAQGRGGKIGPDLSRIGAIRSPRDLLEAIVYPSASFARGFEPYVITTADGRVHTGIIGREAADAVFLYDSKRDEARIPRGEIDELRQAELSIMPDGLDGQLQPEELADLVAFLRSLQ
jgi:putative membrane-bound dehydrogenase-like protein